MQLERPLRVVTPTVDGDVLAVLARADQEFTAPEVHELVGAWSYHGIRRSLLRLVEQGIVFQRRAGPAHLYQLNRSHLAAPLIAGLADLRGLFISRLQERLSGWKTPPVYAALFGSAARGEMSTDSDIDLFIVRADEVDPDDPDWREQLGALARDATAWTGNDTQILEYGDSEVAAGIGAGEGVLAAIATEGIRLAGTSRYLRSERRRSRG